MARVEFKLSGRYITNGLLEPDTIWIYWIYWIYWQGRTGGFFSRHFSSFTELWAEHCTTGWISDQRAYFILL
jgi:hypothetical protein